ncbi:MAG: amidohydrolase family protein [Myxococcales bacterium]|nr:amidohydrolase family protein [Myxococcales bacterium]
MPQKHIVERGESTHLIALKYGFKSWTIIHEFPDNAELFKTRKPALLYPGDILWIPDKSVVDRAGVTNQSHTVVITTPKNFFIRVRLIDEDCQPICQRKYTLKLFGVDDCDVEPEPSPGATDDAGILDVEVPPETSVARLWVAGHEAADITYPEYHCNLHIGHLDPYVEVPGIKQRLFNLGYYFGDQLEPGVQSDLMRALFEFRRAHGIDHERRGRSLTEYVQDAEALQKLRLIHDNIDKKFELRTKDDAGSNSNGAITLPTLTVTATSQQRIPTHRVSPLYDPAGSALNTIRIYTPPKIIFDAHLHIQSNNCAPLPLARGLAADKSPGLARVIMLNFQYTGRKTLNWLGRRVAEDLGKIGPERTDLIADRVIDDSTNFARFGANELQQLEQRQIARMASIVVLPMDMDLAHFEGYYGEPIYYTRDRRFTVITPTDPPLTFILDPKPSRLYDFSEKRRYTAEEPAAGEAAERAVADDFRARGNIVIEEKAQFGSHVYFIKHYDDHTNDGTVTWLHRDEFNLHENFPEQVTHTETAAVRYPWQLLPLFHYDPRRWQLSSTAAGVGGISRHDQLGAWDQPFSHIAIAPRDPFPAQKGRYIGFKMYTSMGYKPSQYKTSQSKDNGDMLLPRLRDYYDLCSKEGIPILAHCTPEGAYTHERHLYYSNTETTRQKRIEMFKRDFVSPDAWKPVLADFPDLKLILAHFTGDSENMAWHGLHLSLSEALGNPKQDLWSLELSKGELLALSKEPLMGRSDWLDSMIDLIKSYPSVYVDISFLDVESVKTEFAMIMLAHPELLPRINFGTDWYMTQTEKKYMGYMTQIERLVKALEDIDRRHFSDEPVSLLTRFSYDNPMRCFDIKNIAQPYSDGLCEKNLAIANETVGWDTSRHEREIKQRLALIKKARDPL